MIYVPSYERRYESKCEEEIARTMCADGPAIATVEGTRLPDLASRQALGCLRSFGQGRCIRVGFF